VRRLILFMTCRRIGDIGQPVEGEDAVGLRIVDRF
jgi:hypothetical protein